MEMREPRARNIEWIGSLGALPERLRHETTETSETNETRGASELFSVRSLAHHPHSIKSSVRHAPHSDPPCTSRGLPWFPYCFGNCRFSFVFVSLFLPTLAPSHHHQLHSSLVNSLPSYRPQGSLFLHTLVPVLRRRERSRRLPFFILRLHFSHSCTDRPAEPELANTIPVRDTLSLLRPRPIQHPSNPAT